MTTSHGVFYEHQFGLDLTTACAVTAHDVVVNDLVDAIWFVCCRDIIRRYAVKL